VVSIFKRFKDCEKMLEDTRGFDFFSLNLFLFFLLKKEGI
jgi:hypothetical protein